MLAPTTNSFLSLLLIITTKNNCIAYFPSSRAFPRIKNSRGIEFEHATSLANSTNCTRAYSIYIYCGNQFSRAKICPDILYYLGDRKVSDHSNDARTRPVYVAIEIRRVEPRPRSRRSRKGNRREKREGEKRSRKRELVLPDGANHSRIDNGTSGGCPYEADAYNTLHAIGS